MLDPSTLLPANESPARTHLFPVDLPVLYPGDELSSCHFHH